MSESDKALAKARLLYEASYFPFLGPGENLGLADKIYPRKFLTYFDYLHEYWRARKDFDIL